MCSVKKCLEVSEAPSQAWVAVSNSGGWTDWRRFVIADRRDESYTITSFLLRPEDGGPVVAHKPGQYLTLRFDEAGLLGRVRSYSISSGPSTECYRITVQREPFGEVSNFLHDQMPLGAVVELMVPAGDFILCEKPTRPIILLSGGVGLTPVLSMLETIAYRHQDVATWWIHGTTNHSTHAMATEIFNLAVRHGKTNVTTFYDTVGEASGGHCGFITFDWLAANTPMHDADIYLCGPGPFVRYFVCGLASAGVPSGRVQHELFLLSR